MKFVKGGVDVDVYGDGDVWMVGLGVVEELGVVSVEEDGVAGVVAGERDADGVAAESEDGIVDVREG